MNKLIKDIINIICWMIIGFIGLYFLGNWVDGYYIPEKEEAKQDSCVLLATNPLPIEEIGEKPYIPTRWDDYKPCAANYNWLGLPHGRDWLSKAEWDGLHIDNIPGITPIDRKRMRVRFKLWKQIHIDEFILFMEKAFEEEKKIFPKLNVSVCVAQSILESRFHTSELSVKAKNMFGHKYRGQEGGFVEYDDDNPNDRFTRFQSEWYSIRAHSKLLISRYGSRIKGKATTKKWLRALCGGLTLKESQDFVAAGGKTYATACYKNSKGDNICYGEKLLRIIKQYDL
tara:strand:- start:9 stop:863 length:855 start_codon:yes stop_codon:yes gene_type:complete